jgi:hypothetical protein
MCMRIHPTVRHFSRLQLGHICTLSTHGECAGLVAGIRLQAASLGGLLDIFKTQFMIAVTPTTCIKYYLSRRTCLPRESRRSHLAEKVVACEWLEAGAHNLLNRADTFIMEGNWRTPSYSHNHTEGQSQRQPNRGLVSRQKKWRVVA